MTGWWWEMAFDASLCEEEILLAPSLWFSVSLKIFRSMEGFVSSSLFCWEGNIFRQSLFPWAVGSQKSTEALRLVRSPGVPSARDRLAVYQASWEYPLFYGQLSCTCKAICFRYFVTGRFLGWLLKLNINHAFLAQFPALYCVLNGLSFLLLTMAHLYNTLKLFPFPNGAYFLHTHTFETLDLLVYCGPVPVTLRPPFPTRQGELPCYPSTHSSILFIYASYSSFH